MIQNRRDRFGLAGFKRSEERFRLAAEMVEIRTGGKILVHDRFSMKSPGSANRRHEERVVDHRL